MNYKIDDLVWAKMNRCPYWPARIVKPDPSVKVPKSKEPHQFVCFFGTDDVAWVHNENIIRHREDIFQTDMAKKQSKALQNAIEDFKSYLALPVGEVPSSSIKEKSGNKIKPTRGIVGKEQGSAQTKAMTVVKVVETGAKKHKRNVLAENSALKEMSEIPPIAGGKKSRSNSSEKLDMSENISFGKRHSCERDESSKNVIVGGKHFIEQDMHADANSCTETSDEMDVSEHVMSFDKKYGFIGLTKIGTAILEKFIRCGMEITLWDDDVKKCEKFTALEKGVKIANSPAELICQCDITFCFQESNTDEFKNIVFGANGILKGFEEAENSGRRPGYVGLTHVNRATSKQIQDFITTKNGMYLDSPIICAEDGEKFDSCKLVISAAGDKELFVDCEKCFKIISDHYFHVSYDIDTNSNANMLLNAISGTTLTAISEAMALADRLNLFKGDALDKVVHSILVSDSVLDRAERMGVDSQSSQVITPLNHVQKNVNAALILADEVSQRMPCTAAANELYKHAKLLNYSDSDVSAIFKAIKS